MVKALPAVGSLAKKNGNGNGKKKGGPITPLEITDSPIGNVLGPGVKPFQGSDSERDQVINNQWRKESNGPKKLKSMLNGENGNGPNGGPGPDGNGTNNGSGGGSNKELRRRRASKGGGVDWDKWKHRAGEAAWYGSGAAYGRYRYREHKEEGALSEGRAQEMAKDVLGREKFIPGIQEDKSIETYYTILGVNRKDSFEKIQAAFRAKAKMYHPDHNETAEAEDIFKQINEAWETLRDKGKRAAYDQKLERDAQERAQREGGASIPPEHTWDELPGSYKKRFRGQAREQIRREKEIYSEARRLGIPVEGPSMKTWDQMSPSEKSQFEAQYGKAPQGKEARSRPMPVGRQKKTLSELELLIEGHKKNIAVVKTEKGLAEGAAREASPDKRRKAMGYIGQAAGVASKVGKSAGGTAVGRKVRSTEAGTQALTDLQRGGPSALKAALGGGAATARSAGAVPRVPGAPRPVGSSAPRLVAGLTTSPQQELQAVSSPPIDGRDLKAAVGGTDRISQSIRTRTSQGRVPRAGVTSLGQRPAFTGRPIGTGTKRKQVTGSRRRKQLSGRI